VPGSIATFYAAVGNGGIAPATNVVLTDTLPAGAKLLSTSISKGTCSGTSTIRCTIDTLAVNETARAAFTIIAPVSGPAITSVTAAASGDVRVDNNTATLSVQIASARRH